VTQGSGKRGRSLPPLARFVLIMALVAVVASPYVSAKRAEAQAVPPIVVAPCVTTPVGAATCALVAAALVAAYVFAGNPTTQADLTRFGAAVEDWWRNLGTEERAAVTAKVNGSGDQFLSDFETYQSLGAALAAQTEAGWLLDGPFDVGATPAGYFIERTEDVIIPGGTTVVYEAWARGVEHVPYYPTGNGCQSACHRGYVILQGPADSAGQVRLLGWWHDDPTTQAFTAVTGQFYGGVGVVGAQGGTPYFSTSLTGDQIAAHGGIDFQLQIMSATNQYGGNTMNAGWRIGPLVWEGGLEGNQILQPTMWDVALVAGAAALPALEDGESRTIKIPALPDGYIGATEPNPDVLLEDGTTGPAVGELVGAPAGGSTTDPAWWEGLFSGVTSAIAALAASLVPMVTDMAEIAAWIGNFPGELAEALATALPTIFTPTAEFTPWAPVQAAALASAPACVVAGVSASTSAAFVGSSDAIEIPGFGPYGSMVIDDGNGWLAGLRTLTGIAAWFLFAAFALRTMRALFGSAPGAADD